MWRPFQEAVQSADHVHKSGTTVATKVKQFLGRLGGGTALSHVDDATDESQGSRFQAQKMESLGRLTGGVAHDFNNLLTVVLGNATALRVHAEARGDAQAMRRAEMIERAAERGGRLAGQLLAFSRKQMLRPETVSVYRIISATHELLAQAAGESARVLIHAEPRLWNSLVDPGQLESAILNLVLNARDAMPVGGDIRISCHNTSIHRSMTTKPNRTPGYYVRIDVKDAGTGIAPELQQKVFEPFFTTKPIGQGSGLGLAQVHGFAGQSGGWVELESTIGLGTTISLFLPRAKGPDSEPLPKADGTVPTGNNQSILVVEPDKDLRTTTCETLNRSGYRAFGAANSSGAFASLVSDERIDVLLTEAQLPGGVSGMALARSARQTRPDLCILVTSGALGDVPDDNQHASLNDDPRFELLLKPYTAPDLARIVGAMLTSTTFSMETERLLADAKNTGSRTLAVQESAKDPQTSTAPGPQGMIPAGVRKNTIRLGVMPFKAIGPMDDAGFSIGLAEEVTTAFSRFRGITCLASASVATLIDEPLHTDRWEQLDLDFLLQGSFRRKRNDIRVVLRLINMRGSGEMTWGRRFDGLLTNVLNLHDDIAAETAAQIAPELLLWEGTAAASRPQVDPDAYDLMLRAIPAIYRLDEVGFRQAGLLLEHSLALDPTSAACHSWLAHWHLFSVGQDWATDMTRAMQRAGELSKRAVELDPGDARGFTVAGHVHAFLNNDAAGALGLHERAIALNPNLALAWCYSGLAHTYLGQHEEAIRRIRQAQRLSPHDPHGFFFDTALAMPLLFTGQYEAAARLARQARDRHPGLSSTYKLLLAALGHLGNTREAASVRRTLLTLEPHFSVHAAGLRSPLTKTDDLECYLQGMRLAGVPEWSRSALAPH